MLRETDLLILRQIFYRGRHERLGVRVQSLSLLLEGWSLYRWQCSCKYLKTSFKNDENSWQWEKDVVKMVKSSLSNYRWIKLLRVNNSFYALKGKTTTTDQRIPVDFRSGTKTCMKKQQSAPKVKTVKRNGDFKMKQIRCAQKCSVIHVSKAFVRLMKAFHWGAEKCSSCLESTEILPDQGTLLVIDKGPWRHCKDKAFTKASSPNSLQSF